ncbi:uncharacterized protein LOC113325268 [Papaver somniferum]|uniref:uncharacterized protein LOC113325268 n=1 Tax=Papaver somniferum TaxID=3469 RepID=UPI000E6F7556|nr:uncharacterized protein LOC113325268 [Papaver somniferum]
MASLLYYGPPVTSHRTRFWESMTSYVQNFNGCKCFIGDFNAICSSTENFGGLPVLNSNISYISNFIHQNHLIDLGYKGHAYTWTNGRSMENFIRQRLDRVLDNPEWCIAFHNAANIATAPPDYKLEALWLSHPEFMDIVRECWSVDEDENILSKLRKLGGFLTEWIRRRIGCIKQKILILKTRLLRIQSWRPTAANIQREKIVLAELNDYLIMEATYWDQRMKQQWAKDGDRNTKHFHFSVQNRRRKNTISHLLVDNQGWITDQKDITSVLIHHFQSLFQEQSRPESQNFSLQCQSTFTIDNDALCRIPTMAEIWTVISKMGSFTSPGPDGFSPVFIRNVGQ